MEQPGLTYGENDHIKYKRALVNNTVDGYGYITDSDVTANSIIMANIEGIGAVYITGSYVTGNNITFWFSEKKPDSIMLSMPFSTCKAIN
jgi:hypothetical protein